MRQRRQWNPGWHRLLWAWPVVVSAAAPTTAGRVHANRAGGWFREPLRIELTSDVPGATIRYTTDGTAPQADSGSVYREPVSIAHTTVLRATAFPAQGPHSAIGTWTYCRPEDLAGQTGAGAPAQWGTHAGQPVPADYAMDTNITATPTFSAAAIAAVATLPTVAVVLDPRDLWDPASGIYANPTESGENWERPAHVEYFPVGSTTATIPPAGFNLDCGLRIQGGWNRRPEESPKHSLRLVFRKRYGEARLRYPLFQGRPEEFTTLILRGGNNNSWLHWSSEERRRADYLRDEWMRQTYAALGQVSARGRLTHVYLNGLYWGIYNLCERPDEHFAAGHLGGAAADYESRNADKLLNGTDEAWRSLLRLVEGGVPDAAALAEVGQRLDLPAFIDYLLLNLYGANGDLDGSSNWYAARRRTQNGRWVFFVWDGERTLEGIQDSRLQEDAGDSPWRIFQRLRSNPEFRRQFSARAKVVCQGDGPLAPGPAARRFRQLSETLAPALILESARWGDHRLTVNPYKTGPYERYTVEQHWQPEIRRLLNEYFPARTDAFLKQLQAAGLIVE